MHTYLSKDMAEPFLEKQFWTMFPELNYEIFIECLAYTLQK